LEPRGGKDKALAEAAALLVLQKRSPISLGGRGRRHGAEERRMIISTSMKRSLPAPAGNELPP